MNITSDFEDKIQKCEVDIEMLQDENIELETENTTVRLENDELLKV